jgi:uncharacterized protein (DUF885 family)
MKRLLKWLSGLIVLVVVLAGAFFVHVWYFKPYKIDWFYTRVFGQFAVRSPEMMSSLRVLPPWMDFYSNKLDDASPKHDEDLAKIVHGAHDTLMEYDRNAMDKRGQLSFDVMEYFLRMQIEGDAFRYYDFPVNQMFGVQSTLPNFMAQTHQVTDASEAKSYIERLHKFPKKFDEVIESLKLRESKSLIPPQFMVEDVLKQMDGFTASAPKANPLYVSFKEKLDKIPADKMDQASKDQYLADVEASIQNDVYPSYKKMSDYFKALQPKAQGNYGAWHLPNGDAYYAWCVRQHTTTDMTPEQVHQLGLSEVARVTQEIDAILKDQGLTEGTVGARVQQLAHNPDSVFPNTADGKQAMLKQYQSILDDVNAGLGSAFDMRPKLGVEVKPVPEFSEKTAPGAYYEPGSFDGTRPGTFYANMRDTNETPKWAMRTLAYHEGIPGHHFQTSVAQQMKDLPFFQRILPFTAYEEGWALYAERLAWELGFEKNPLDNLGRLRDEMMRAVRLVVDTGIHYKRWTREQAIQYMMDNTGMAESDVTSEIERYFVDPGQALAYKVGMLKILEVREKAKAELGEQFSLAQFHDQVLRNGALPLELLERSINDWILATKSKT